MKYIFLIDKDFGSFIWSFRLNDFHFWIKPSNYQ